MKKKGIAIAGNMLVDMLYPVERYPASGELVSITGAVSKSSGGCLCNDIIDLAVMDPELPLVALGRTGPDEAGKYLMDRLHAYPNIDTQHVVQSGVTSFTLVISDDATKQRTFYHYRGGNAEFCEEDIPWEQLNVDLLHIGYILLLDALDEEDAVFGTKMAKLLHTAKAHGIKTSIDVVSESSNRFQRLVPPALRYTDYCVINELEAGATTGIELRGSDGTLYRNRIPAALEKMKELGVSTWAVIHCPEAGFGLDENGNFVEVDSLRLPEGWIQGTVGAGDAFCSGVLYGAWNGEDLRSAIELGTAAAACSLSAAGATEGMRTVEEIRKLYLQLR